jgi:uncharacterized protein (DUF433 family)
MDNLLNRISLDPAVCNGKPTIRSTRFTVSQLLELFASGMSQEQVLADYPYLGQDDLKACLLYASFMANTKSVLPLAN